VELISNKHLSSMRFMTAKYMHFITANTYDEHLVLILKPGVTLFSMLSLGDVVPMVPYLVKIWGPNLHSLNPEILPSRVEISMSNLLSCHVAVFLIYRIRFIENCWRR
jgi:hypothetical protein